MRPKETQTSAAQNAVMVQKPVPGQYWQRSAVRVCWEVAPSGSFVVTQYAVGVCSDTECPENKSPQTNPAGGSG
eukprot:794859-Rhodomonas_salina.4